MEVKWLLEPEVFEGDEASIIDALSRLGIEHKVVEFGYDYADYEKAFGEDDCVVFHGSFQLAWHLRRNVKWIPGIYCNDKKFDCAYYYPRFGDHLLNCDYVMLPFGELDRRKNRLFEIFEHASHPLDSIFIRPTSGLKTFTGNVVKKESWEEDLKLLGFYGVEPEEIVVVAGAEKITGEWRLVVVDNKVVASSEYKKYKNPLPLEEVEAYGQKVLDEIDYSPDRAWTLDIGQIEWSHGSYLAVVEVGSFSCAGLYQCDPEPIIHAVNNIALEEWKEFHD